MAPTNNAAWITAKHAKPLEVSEAPLPKPGKGEVLIKNAALAINPVDWKIQEQGYFVDEYPFILGEDVAGTVEEVGEGVTKYGKGDRVIGHAISLFNKKNEYSSFQNYTLVPAISVACIPDSLSFAQASVLPLAVNTVIPGLYPKEALGLPLPTVEDSGKSSNGTILVIGGSSSVGTVAVQLARASGLKVISTASSKNHDYVKNLGADEVFDHNDESIVTSQIVHSVKASGAKFVGTYDSISLPNTHKISFGVAKTLGGGSGSKIATTLPAPEELQNEGKGLGITFCNVFAGLVPVQMQELCEAVWWDFLPKALETGKFKALPEALVVGKGLENVQKGMDRQKEGVSAKKVVVEL